MSKSKLTLRSYQQKVLDAALTRNTLAFLPTGAGKTLIAVHLIQARLNDLRKSVATGGKRQMIFFIAPTKILSGQQKRYISNHCDAFVSELTGDSRSVEGVSYASLSKQSWQSTFLKTEVLVVTPDICKQLLNHHYFDIADVNCIIIDECHHAFGNNPLVSICDRIKASTVPESEKPLLLAMTASLVPSKKGDVKNIVTDLEELLNCKLLCYPDVLSDFRKLVPVPNCSLYRYAMDAPSLVEDFFATPSQPNRKVFSRSLIERIFETSSGSVQSCPTALLLNSSLRVRHGYYVFLIRKFARTLKMKCSDFEELSDLHLDEEEGVTSPSEGGLGTESKSSSVKRRTLLPPSKQYYHGIPDINVALSQTARLADDCGFVCALQSLQICLYSSVKALVTSGMDITHADGMLHSDEYFIINSSKQKNNKKGRYLHSNSEVTTTVDMDRIRILAEEIRKGPFESLELVNAEYVSCISILDFFFALISNLNPKLCGGVRDLTIQMATEKLFKINEVLDTPAGESSSEEPPTVPPSDTVVMEVPLDGEKEEGFIVFGCQYPLSMSVCQIIVCAMFDLLSTNEPVCVPLSPDGVLILFTDFCEQVRHRYKSFTLTEEDCKTAVCDSIASIWRCFPRDIMIQIFDPSSSTEEECDYVPLDPGQVEVLEKGQGEQSSFFTPESRKRLSSMVLGSSVTNSSSKFPSAKSKSDRSRLGCSESSSSNFKPVSNKVKALYSLWKELCMEARKASEEARIDAANKAESDPEAAAAATASKDSKMEEDEKLFGQDNNDSILQNTAQGDDWSGIVFCRMRLTALSVHFVLSLVRLLETYGSNTTKSGEVATFDTIDAERFQATILCDEQQEKSDTSREMEQFRPIHIIGRTRQSIQLETLLQFKLGRYNVLFATDVVEEGLDVKACQYIINFDMPLTVRSYMQRRGRARAFNPHLVALVPYGHAGSKMVQELLSFTKQEKEMEECASLDTTAEVDAPLEEVSAVSVLEKITADRFTEAIAAKLNAQPSSTPPVTGRSGGSNTSSDSSNSGNSGSGGIKRPSFSLHSNSGSDGSFNQSGILPLAPALTPFKGKVTMPFTAPLQMPLTFPMSATSPIQSPHFPNNYSGVEYAFPWISVGTPDPFIQPKKSPNTFTPTVGQKRTHSSDPFLMLPPAVPSAKPPSGDSDNVSRGGVSTTVLAPLSLPWSTIFTAPGAASDPAPSPTVPAKKANKAKKVKKASDEVSSGNSAGLPSISSSAAESEVGTEEEYLESYSVHKTGAVADLRSSVQLLMRFCSHLPHDTYFTPQPIYWLESTRYTKPENGKEWLFRCSVLLPPCVSSSARCVIGPKVASKTLAKGAASLKCIKLLHESGELNDWLVTNGSKASEKAEKLELVAASKASKVTVESPEAELVSVIVKTVADTMAQPPEILAAFPEEKASTDPVDTPAAPSAEKFHKLFLYGVQADAADEITEDVLRQCRTCGNSYFTLSQMGIALSFELPGDIFDAPLNFNLRESERLKIKFKFLEERSVSTAELCQMQRFHRSVVCWESELKRTFTPGSSEQKGPDRAGLENLGEVWIPEGADLSAYNARFNGEIEEKLRNGEKVGRDDLSLYNLINGIDCVLHDEWVASSNGAWYVVFPLSPDLCSNRNPHVCDFVDPDDSLRTANSTFKSRQKWSAFLKTSADEAQILAHNLRMQENLNKQQFENFNQPILHPTLPADPSVFRDSLVTRGPGSVFWVVPDAFTDTVTLNKVLKYVRLEPLSANCPVPAAVSTSAEAGGGSSDKVENADQDNQTDREEVNPSKDSGAMDEDKGNGTTEKDTDNGNAQWTLSLDKVTSEETGEFDETRALDLLEVFRAEVYRRFRGDFSLSRSVKTIRDKEKDVDLTVEEMITHNLISLTFKQHILVKSEFLRDYVAQVEIDPDHKLIKVLPVNSNLTLTFLLGRSLSKSDKALLDSDIKNFVPIIANSMPRKKKLQSNTRKDAYHSHNAPIYLMPEMCRPIGRLKWLAFGLLVPSITWRVQSLMICVEARGVVVDQVSAFEKRVSSLLNSKRISTDEFHKILGFGKGNATEEQTQGDELNEDTARGNKIAQTLTVPNGVVMLEALTPRLTRENIDSERLELLGDSLLKLVTSVELFRIYPNKHEGFLTDKRGKVISNAFLTRMSKKLGVHKYLRGYPLSNGKQSLLVRPPGMSFTAQRDGLSMWNKNTHHKAYLKMDDDEPPHVSSLVLSEISQEAVDFRNMTLSSPSTDGFDDGISYFRSLYPEQQLENAVVRTKALADLMEAIIGGFYVTGGISSGVWAIKALGAWPMISNNIASITVVSESGAADSANENANTNAITNTEQPESEVVKARNKNARVLVVDSIEPKGDDDIDSAVGRNDDLTFPTIHLSKVERDPLVFPPNFPEPLKRAAMGIELEKSVTDQENEAHLRVIQSPSMDPSHTVRTTSAAKKVEIIDSIADILGYRFKDWNILDEALTHCSVQHKTSNQRLEFLGDAILDFTVVAMLFRCQPWARQGELSGQKSNSLCNKNLGRMGAWLGVHKFLNLMSPQLEYEFKKIEKIVDKMKATQQATSEKDSEETVVAAENSMDVVKEAVVVVEPGYSLPLSTDANTASAVSNESEQQQQKAVPKAVPKEPTASTLNSLQLSAGPNKALADLIEALFGAVYMDNGGDISEIEKIVTHINLLPQLG